MGDGRGKSHHRVRAETAAHHVLCRSQVTAQKRADAPDLEPGKLEHTIQISEIPVLQEFVSEHFRQSRRYRKSYSISHPLGLETLEYR